VNRDEFPDDTVTVAAGASVTFRFLAVPDEKIKRGTYHLNAFVVTGMGGEHVAGTLGRVNFHSDRSKPAIVTFDHDYPSTPRERENYEAQKRKAMSAHPVLPGEQFAEHGNYRLVANAAQRSRFVTRFSAGERAPDMADWAKFVDTEPIADERGQEIRRIDEGYGWVWEADPPADFMAPDLDCQPGEPCPRSGRWFARVRKDRAWPPTHNDSLNEVIQCREGQTMPASWKVPKWASDSVVWTWTGI
jgi:hypothetical protein